jgi:hypothetical protein
MKRIISGIGLLFVAVAAVAPTADAATIGAWSGRPNGGSAAMSCYSEAGFDSVENNGSCATSTSGAWEVPLYVNADGYYNVSVALTCSQTVPCAMYGVSPGGVNQGEAFSNVPPNQSGYYQLGDSANVINGGYLFLACWLPPGCKLAGVNWGPA